MLSEEIAFYQGQDREKKTMRESFDKVHTQTKNSILLHTCMDKELNNFKIKIF